MSQAAPTSLADRTAILLVDFQKGIADAKITVENKNLRRALDALLRLADLYKVPVIVSGVAASGPPEIFDEIGDRLGTVPVHVRTTPNCFDMPEIRGAIEATGRKTLIVAGVVTEIAVQLPALTAAAEGYDVRIPVEVVGGITRRSEEAAFARMTHAGIATTSLATLAAEFAGDFAAEKGGDAAQILFEVVAKKYD